MRKIRGQRVASSLIVHLNRPAVGVCLRSHDGRDRAHEARHAPALVVDRRLHVVVVKLADRAGAVNDQRLHHGRAVSATQIRVGENIRPFEELLHQRQHAGNGGRRETGAARTITIGRGGHGIMSADAFVQIAERPVEILRTIRDCQDHRHIEGDFDARVGVLDIDVPQPHARGRQFELRQVRAREHRRVQRGIGSGVGIHVKIETGRNLIGGIDQEIRGIDWHQVDEGLHLERSDRDIAVGHIDEIHIAGGIRGGGVPVPGARGYLERSRRDEIRLETPGQTFVAGIDIAPA